MMLSEKKTKKKEQVNACGGVERGGRHPANGRDGESHAYGGGGGERSRERRGCLKVLLGGAVSHGPAVEIV